MFRPYPSVTSIGATPSRPATVRDKPRPVTLRIETLEERMAPVVRYAF
jgi:hypothetical protein